MTDSLSEVHTPAPKPAQTSWILRRPLWLRIVAPALVVLIVAAIIVIAIPRGFTAKGQFLIEAPELTSWAVEKANKKDCDGVGVDKAIASGTGRVVVSDISGKTLAVGHLDTGHPLAGTLGCLFDFSVSGVPTRAAYYVSIAGLPRLKYSQKEMRTWVPMLTGR